MPFQITPNKIKRFAANVLDFCGINSFGFYLQKTMFFPFIRAINYHNVYENEAHLFESHLKYYAENFVSVDLEMLENFLQTGKWDYEKPGLILSFDDGHITHFQTVAPLLEKYGFKGWFFVPIGLMNLEENEQRSDEGLTFEQLLYLDKNHIIGSHTKTHLRLRKSVPLDVLENETVGSKLHLEKILQHEIPIFCWVGGEEETYSREAADFINKHYRFGFMTNSAVIRHQNNPLQLQRTNIEAENPLSLLRFQISGLLDIIYKGKRQRVNQLTK